MIFPVAYRPRVQGSIRSTVGKPSRANPTPTSPEDCYPTPPPSPVFPDVSLPIDNPVQPCQTPVIPPIPILLSTDHRLPHVAALRLIEPPTLLATLGRNKVLSLDPNIKFWDRMPYNSITSTVKSLDAMEEDRVEGMLGGSQKSSEAFMQGIHRAMRTNSRSTEHISSIFVHPPTPERIVSPSSEAPPPVAKLPQKKQSESIPVAIISRESSREASPAGSPVIMATTLPVSNANGMAVPLQVLPEVRSPPKKTIAMTADSLQVAAKRGRRPRLFGFTEMTDSATSSAASSATNSPDHTPLVAPQAPSRWAEHTSASSSSTPAFSTPNGSSSPATFMPRRHPVRARSEAALMASAQHIPPRRRENGLKLNFDGIVPLPQPAEIQSASVISPYSAKLIRKKSGEILKPALKSIGPLQANGTPMYERPSIAFESKSMPSTPSCPKYVHFDSQLERVKLFLHDQKPQVVSRSGSPTADTTSEGDEFPFPSTDDERDSRKVLQVSLPNFPTSHPPDSDLYLESLFLDDDRKMLKGVVACKNIAYQKWVAVRFTFDWWQTTSEVSASYKESIKGGKYDRFVFSVKLNDMLSRIEEKTLFMAIRYNAEGQEIWDSNGGQNYQVLFQKVSPVPTGPRAARGSVSIQPGMGRAVGGRTSQWSVTGSNGDDRLADLRAKLDRLTADEPDRVPVSPNSSRFFSFDFSGNKKASSPNGSPMRPTSALDGKSSDLPAAGPALAARYDFGAALKTVRRNSNSPSGRTVELPDVKTGLLNYGKANHGHAATEFYSPKFSQSPLNGPEYFFSPTSTSSSSLPSPLPVPDVKVDSPSPPVPDTARDDTPTPTDTTPASYATVPAVVPSSVTKAVSLKRPNGFLKRNATYPAKFTIGGDDMPELSPNVSPPQLVSSSSGDSTATETPTVSPRSPPDMPLAQWSPTSKSGDSSDEASLASYSSFLEQFCWGGNGITPERRSHSASSLDRYFADSPGNVTPRAVHPSQNSTSDTPSSNASYYTSYTSTPTTRDDLDHVEHALGGHRSPPIVC
ncbi:hypothetical protein IAU60_000659 [Kwoniella sp. DSM 27419]